MACIIRLGQPRLLDIVDDAWAQDTLPDDDISIPQVPPPATPEGGGPGGGELNPKMPRVCRSSAGSTTLTVRSDLPPVLKINLLRYDSSKNLKCLKRRLKRL